MSVRNWLKFIVLGMLWGSSFLWIKIALREVGPFTLVTLRVGFALLTTIVVLFINRSKVPLKQYWKVFLVIGLINTALPFALISWAELHISSGMASILNATVPLWAIVIAPIFLKDDPFTLPKIIGLVVGFSGVVLLMSDQLGGGNGTLLGYAAMLVATFFYASAGVYARRTTKGLKPEVQTFGQMASAFLFIFPAALLIEAPFNLPDLPLTWTGLAWLGILGTSIATLIYYSLLHSIGPTRTLLVTYIFPLVGVILGILILNESISWRQAVGALMVISGIVIVNSRLQFFKQRRDIGKLAPEAEQAKNLD